MDFSQFDVRSRAERGHPVDLKDPDTGEPIMDGDKRCRVLIYGPASRKVQAEVRKITLDIMEAAEDGKIVVMEDAHRRANTAAAPYIAGFENVARGDRPCEATEEDIAWFLDLSFPEMGPVVGEDGKPTGKFELKNKPFATQILEAVNERGQHLGNGSRG